MVDYFYMNKAVDLSLFEKLLRIVGHTEEESKDLAEKMFVGIVQRLIVLSVAKLDEADRNVVMEMTKNGVDSEKILDFVGSHSDPIELKKLGAGISAKYMEDYYQKISEKLTDKQKEEISSFVFDNK